MNEYRMTEGWNFLVVMPTARPSRQRGEHPNLVILLGIYIHFSVYFTLVSY